MRKVLLLAVVLSACIEGPEGPPGPVGPQGPAGNPGSGLVSSLHCGGTVYVSAAYNLGHDIYTFADGSVLATCYVWGSGFAVSGTNMWKAGTHGAEVGGCIVEADVDSGTYGFWTFDRTSTVSSLASIHDQGYPTDGRAFVITCAGG